MPGVAPAAEPLDLDILDIAPTLLHQLAMPIPTTMQGNVATFGAAATDGAYTKAESSAVEKRLEELGYLG